MAKKKQAAKSAAPPALAPQFPDFNTELSTALENEHNRAERKLASDIASVRVYQNDAYEAILKIGRAETLTIAKEAIQRTIGNARTATLEEGRREGYEKGLSEGEERGRTAEREAWMTRRGPTMVETTSQTTSSTTADAVTQTAPLEDAAPHLPSPPLSATSPLTTPAQPPSALSTSLTATTTIPSSAPNLLPAPRKRRHSLLGRATAPHQAPQPPVLCPKPLVTTATSLPTTAATPATTTSGTTARDAAATHTAGTTSETANQAVTNSQLPSVAHQTELCDYEGTRSLERVVHLTEQLCEPQDHQRRSRSPSKRPNTPHLTPPTPVLHVEPPSPLATSYATTAEFPAPPLSGTRATAQERQSALVNPAEYPRDAFQPPTLPQIPQKRAASPPPVWCTPPTAPTTPFSPANIPCPPPTPGPPPSCSSSTQLSPRRAVSPSFTAAGMSEPPPGPVLRPPPSVEPPSNPVPPCSTPIPTRLDWAEDTASMPAPPVMYPPPRDLSPLKTNRAQPFGTLRRRTRRRRAPPHLCIPLQKFLSPSHIHLSHPQPFITRRHPSGIGLGKPTITVPFGGTPTPATAPPVPKLDWDQDPRLVSLSQALCALGWIPPC